MLAAATGVEPAPLQTSCIPPTLHGIHYFLLSSSMTLTQDTHLLGIITHFQALSAIIAPSCYAASLYSPSFFYVSLSKSRFVGGRGRIRTSFICQTCINPRWSSAPHRLRPFHVPVFPGCHPKSLKVLFGYMMIA